MKRVAISGLIGAGKTSLSNLLHSHRPDSRIRVEPVTQNPYIDDFYNDPKTFAWKMQVYVIIYRFFEEHIEDCKYLWEDRTPWEDCVFVDALHYRGIMDERDTTTYYMFYERICSLMPRPKVIIYIQVSPETCLERIKKRGRECEQSITIEYLRDLEMFYERRMGILEKDYGIRVVRINGESEFDVKDIIEKIDMV
jgi:deoxyadenosine kinase